MSLSILRDYGKKVYGDIPRRRFRALILEQEMSSNKKSKRKRFFKRTLKEIQRAKKAGLIPTAPEGWSSCEELILTFLGMHPEGFPQEELTRLLLEAEHDGLVETAEFNGVYCFRPTSKGMAVPGLLPFSPN